jgi:hypothetical protein
MCFVLFQVFGVECNHLILSSLVYKHILFAKY